MKRKIYATFLCFTCFLSWFLVIRDIKTGNSEYLELVSEAQDLLDKKVYSGAESNYKKAILLKSGETEPYLGLAKTYFEEEKYDEVIETCEKILKIEPKCQEAMILEAKSLYCGGKYSKSLELLNQVEQTKQIKSLILEIKSKYSLTYFNIENPKNWDVASPLTLHQCTIEQENNAYTYNSKGKTVTHGDLSYIGSVSEDKELYPAINDGTWCFVNEDGERVLVPDEEYDFLGPFLNGYAVAKKNGTFGYIDKEFNEYSFKYEKAYNFVDNTAVVKEDGVIKIISSDFSTINETEFTDVAADEYGYASHFGVSVFIKNSKYYICTQSGAKISNDGQDYMELPMQSGGIVAFENENLWGFMNSKTGEVVIPAQYEEAKSFNKGLAPVKVDGKWGYIDEKGNQIISPTFTYAGTISDQGSAWVSNKAGFALLTFYFLSE